MAKHAKASPSKMKQILHCTASLDAEEGFPDEESPYAAEGTACHSMAEYLIKRFLKIRSRRPVSDYYTDDNLEAVDEYVAYVTEQIELARAECTDPLFAVEYRVDLSRLIPECFGTADMVIITDRKVHICDLKMGQGVPVFAEQNEQLMTYGLGVLMMAEMLYPIEVVELTIVQPRLNSLSTWEIGIKDLKAWGAEVLVPKVNEALSHNGTFAPGQDACRFCKARFTCRARSEFFLELAKHEFKEPNLLTDAEMTEVLTKADALKKWVTEVYAYAQNEAIEKQKSWPGYKLVRGKSNRRYTDEESVIKIATDNGYQNIFKKDLIGITDMQRLMGKKEFERLLGDLIYKPEGKLTLVPESDKREAVSFETAKDDFDDLFDDLSDVTFDD